MTLWRPPQIPYLSDFLFGHWPDGDEDAMRRAAGHWSDMAKALEELKQPADLAMVGALDAIDGKAHSAMSSYWQNISGGDGSELQRLINTCNSFAEQLEHGATDIEHTKLTIYISAMVMVAMTAWSWVPGAGQAGEVAAAAAVKVTVRAAVQKLLAEITTKGAAFVAKRLAMRVGAKVATQAAIGAGIGAGTDAAAQGIQLAAGHREDGFDLAGFLRATGAGAVAGGVTGPMSEGIGGNLAGRLAGGAEPGLVAGLVGKNVAEVPANVVGNAAAQLATNPDHSIDVGTLLEGAGGGLASKPEFGGHGTSPGGEAAGPHPESAPDKPAAGGSDHSPDPSPRPSPSDPGTPAAADGTHPSGITHQDSGTLPAETPPATGTDHAATVAAGHETSVAAQPDSSTHQSGDARPPSESRANSGSQTTSEPGSANQPTSAPAGSSDRAAPSPSQAPNVAGAERPVPAARPASEVPARPDTPGPAADRAASPQRAAEPPRSPAADASVHRTTESPAAGPASRPEPTPARPVHTEAARPDAAGRPVPEASHRPSVAERPSGAPPRQHRPDTPGRTADGPISRNTAEPQHVSDGGARTETSAPPDSGRDSAPRASGPDSAPATPRHGAPENASRQDLSNSDRRPTGRPEHIADPISTDVPQQAQPAPVAVSPPVHSPVDDRPTNAKPAEAASHEGVPDSPPEVNAGGVIRPRDDFAAFEWAEDAYERFRSDDSDIDHMARVLADHPRADGSHFSREDIRRIKDHLFREEHPIRDYDGEVVHRRYDADPDIAEAWIRVRSGRPDPADLVLLEHEFAEANYYRDHPGALYQDAHAHANIDHNWAEVAAPRSGERYDTFWGSHDGATDLLQPNQEHAGRGGVPVRGDERSPGPHPDDRQGEQRPPHGPTGGRDLPSGRGPDHAPGQTREAVAQQRSDRFLSGDDSERASGEKDGPVRALPEDSGNRDRGDLPVRQQRDRPEPRVGDREERPDRRTGRPAGDKGGRPHPGAEGERPQLAARGRDTSLSERAEPAGPHRGGDRPPDIAGLFSRRGQRGADSEGSERPGSSWDPASYEPPQPTHGEVSAAAAHPEVRRDADRSVPQPQVRRSQSVGNSWRAPESEPPGPTLPTHDWRAPESNSAPPIRGADRSSPHGLPEHSPRPGGSAPASGPGSHPPAGPPRSARSHVGSPHPGEPSHRSGAARAFEQQPRGDRVPQPDSVFRGGTRPPETERPVHGPGRGSESAPLFEVRRSTDESGRPVTDVVVRVHLDQGLGVSNQQMRDIAQAAWDAAGEIAGPHQRLPWGERPRLQIEFVADPARADLHAAVDHSGRTEQGVWSTGSTIEALAGRLREHLGLPADHDGRVALEPSDIRSLSDRIAEANTGATLRGLPDTREIGPGKLAPLEDPSYQEYVRNSLREGDHYATWFDPRTHEAGRLINDGGPEVPGRRNSCGDNIMAALSSFYGDPQISHPRHPDLLPDGRVDYCSPERGVTDRIGDWLGAEWQSFGGRDAASGFSELHDLIDSLGPGSSAAVAIGFHARDPRTGLPQYHTDGSPVIEAGHGVVVVYPRDAEGPVWWDPLTGQASDRPFPDLVADAASLHAIPLNQDARPHVPQADSHSRGGEPVPGRSARHQQEVPDVPLRTGLGDLPDPVRTGDRSGWSHRPVEDGARRSDRSDHRTPEPAGRHGRPDVHSRNAGRGQDAWRADLPAADARAHDPYSGRSDHSRVSDPARIDNRPASEHGLPLGDRQAHQDAPAAGNHEHPGSGVDRPSAANRGSLAEARDHPVLEERDHHPTADRTGSDRAELGPRAGDDREQLRSELPELAGDHGGTGPGHAAEPKPNLGDLFPPDGLPVDQTRVLPLLRQAIDGEHGGLRVRVERVYGGSDALHVETKIYDERGNQVGYANRSYYAMEGRIVADHTMFRLDKNLHGQGCAGEFNNAMFAWYRQSGVDEVILRANIDVGSYAWARQGFDFANQHDAVRTIRGRLNREINGMRDDLQQLELDQAQQYDAERARKIEEIGRTLEKAEEIFRRFYVGAADFPRPAEIAELGRPETLRPGESRELWWPGKRVFMEPGVKISWHGVKKMQEE